MLIEGRVGCRDYFAPEELNHEMKSLKDSYLRRSLPLQSYEVLRARPNIPRLNRECNELSSEGFERIRDNMLPT